ncbi:MAG: hypothetical protein IPJ88_15895 [Myxococcales bacterium]|nr:MAG: hypothetical protein IPJ88_15895 [Myxococcales bacterium]
MNLAKVCVLSLCLVTALASSASAQNVDPVNADFEGKVGGGLLGAELGLAVVSVFGVKDAWPYLIAAGVGATGGAIAGQFLIDNNNSVEAGIGVMAAGMALAIPAIVLAVSSAAYDPEDEMEAIEKKDTAVVPPPGRSVSQVKEPKSSSNAPVFAALGVSESGRLSMGLPVPAVLSDVSNKEQLKYGQKANPELRFSLVQGHF